MAKREGRGLTGSYQHAHTCLPCSVCFSYCHTHLFSFLFPTLFLPYCPRSWFDFSPTRVHLVSSLLLLSPSHPTSLPPSAIVPLTADSFTDSRQPINWLIDCQAVRPPACLMRCDCVDAERGVCGSACAYHTACLSSTRLPWLAGWLD